MMDIRAQMIRENLKKVDTPHEALPRLYISSVAATRSKDTLDSFGITHILTAAKSIPPRFKGHYNYMLLEVQDWNGEDLLSYFDEAIKFIDEGRKEGKVLVHCMAGVSRSASIVIAYMMYAQRVPFIVALNALRKARPIVDPNPAFRRQLEIFERKVLGIHLPPISFYAPSDSTTRSSTPISEEFTTMSMLVFQLEHLFSQDKAGQRRVLAGEDPNLILTHKLYLAFSTLPSRPPPSYILIDLSSALEDVSEKSSIEPDIEVTVVGGGLGGLALGDESDLSHLGEDLLGGVERSTKKPIPQTVWVWCCKHCQRYLITPLNIIHTASEHIEVEAMEWMTDLGKEKGELRCPKCKAVVGEYNWQHIPVDNGPDVPLFKLANKDIEKIDVKLL